MKIHFVCTANTFRSRLAEAFIKSKGIQDLEITSSGIEADRNVDGPVTWYGQKILRETNLIPYEKPFWDQTTGELLNSSDLIIFMQEWHHDQAGKRFGYDKENYEVWNVDDIISHDLSAEEKIKMSEEIYTKIKTQVNDLISRNFRPKNS